MSVFNDPEYKDAEEILAEMKAEQLAALQPPIMPTYYVRHPDGSYSEATPQLSAAPASAAAPAAIPAWPKTAREAIQQWDALPQAAHQPPAQDGAASQANATLEAAAQAIRDRAVGDEIFVETAVETVLSIGAASQADKWRKLTEGDHPDTTRLLDVILDNGVYRYQQEYRLIDWTAVEEWRYSHPAAEQAQAKQGEQEERDTSFEAWISASGRGHMLEKSKHGWYIDLNVTAWYAGWCGAWQAARSLPRQHITGGGK